MIDAQIAIVFVILVRITYTVAGWAAMLSNHPGSAAVFRETAHTMGRVLPSLREFRFRA